MKKQLTTEEELLKAKLENVDFAFQEGHWAEMQQLIGKRSFFSKYGTLTKAAVGFIVIAAAVYLMQADDENKKAEVVSINSTTTAETKLDSESIVEEKTAVEFKSEPELGENKTEISISEKATKQSENSNKNDLAVKAGPTDSKQTKTDKTAVNKEPKSLDESKIVSSTIQVEELTVVGDVCFGNKIQVKAALSKPLTNKQKVQWTVNGKVRNTTTPTLELELTDAGIYNIEAGVNSNIADNYKSEKISFTVNEAQNLDFTYRDNEDPFHDLEASFEATPLGLSNYKWTVNGTEQKFTERTPKIVFEKRGIYDIELSHTDAEGCLSKISKPINVDVDFDPLAPNAFTPNGDGINDDFMPQAFTIRDDHFHLSIYDLNGGVIFHSKSTSEPWNGRRNNSGEIMSKGNYVWKVIIENNESIKKSFTGRVKIMDFD